MTNTERLRNAADIAIGCFGLAFIGSAFFWSISCDDRGEAAKVIFYPLKTMIYEHSLLLIFLGGIVGAITPLSQDSKTINFGIGALASAAVILGLITTRILIMP